MKSEAVLELDVSGSEPYSAQFSENLNQIYQYKFY